MDTTLGSEYGHDDLFSNYVDDVYDSIYPDLDSSETTSQPTLTLPEVAQNPPTTETAQRNTFIFGSDNNTIIQNTAQQVWNSNAMNSFYDIFRAPSPVSGNTQDLVTETPATQNLMGPQNKPRTLSDKLRQGKKIILSCRNDGKVKNEDPADIYEKPPTVQAWGPLIKHARVTEHLFEYCRYYVELNPAKRFTQDELILFMKGTECPNPERKLTLWIQNSPSQVNGRYAMGGNSAKCRYKHCPGKFTIWKGFLRIAFDEFSDKTGLHLDPFHNAGYMHLHCFEKIFDLAYLIHYGAAQYGFQIKPDVRTFPIESRNPMSLLRDHPQMLNAYYQWLRDNKQRCDLLFMAQADHDGFHIPSPPSHHTTLGYKLTMYHLSHEVSHRVNMRENRGGAHIGIHKGNLERFMHIKAKMRDGKNNVNKRRSHDDDKEEEESDTQDSITYNPRPTKRPRGRKVASIDTSVDSTPTPVNIPFNTDLNTNPIVMGNFNYQIPDFNMMGMEMGMGNLTGFPLNFNTYPVITNPQQRILPTTTISPTTLQSPGPRTRLRSRQMSTSLVGFLNTHPNLTLTQAQEIGAAIADEPSYIQDNILSAVQPETANTLLRDGIVPEVESKIKKLNKRQLKDLERVIERIEKNGNMTRASSMW
ncbi:uncharacterized protein PODANS_7_2870 [Podospora anserina S mat+]|uniref:Podospora anserina S mat+ genomic DNA chromosome 7, supercontig 1 n=1 Tax=Podospora anserina (strain S / ATCC MYA-4624 / DSM 980 / FGSC 10383) TaxID=515849 RepID=B2AVI1_PODAN|nr:uncharacterized protein PODANS_7_2870 [Podospora anserina S mat+]CAP68405.1 unnamed protein product [Podospora anserina S mat+]CDP31877.1 Putative protein of unknown function [Podospora anserina S mat+]